jgi:hypothetical protein
MLLHCGAMSRPTTPATRAAIAAAIVVLVVAVAVIATVALRRSNDDDPVERALDLLQQERKFDSSTEAVVHFADVYQHLVDAAAAFPKDCDVDHGKGRCLALNQAASWSINFSPASGHCTQPAVQEGRLAMLDYVTRAKTLAGDTTEPPPLPPIPSC